MGFDERFGQVWGQVTDLQVQDPSDHRCFYARGFGAWVDQLVTGIREPNIMLVNQAKVLLLDKYFEWHRFVPTTHRLRLGFRGHACIFQVFEGGYERLKVVELSLTPPLLFLPDNAPIIGGIFLGEDLGQRDEDKKDAED